MRDDTGNVYQWVVKIEGDGQDMLLYVNAPDRRKAIHEAQFQFWNDTSVPADEQRVVYTRREGEEPQYGD